MMQQLAKSFPARIAYVGWPTHQYDGKFLWAQQVMWRVGIVHQNFLINKPPTSSTTWIKVDVVQLLTYWKWKNLPVQRGVASNAIYPVIIYPSPPNEIKMTRCCLPNVGARSCRKLFVWWDCKHCIHVTNPYFLTKLYFIIYSITKNAAVIYKWITCMSSRFFF